jgi:hypothetical protein
VQGWCFNGSTATAFVFAGRSFPGSQYAVLPGRQPQDFLQYLRAHELDDCLSQMTLDGLDPGVGGLGAVASGTGVHRKARVAPLMVPSRLSD